MSKQLVEYVIKSLVGNIQAVEVVQELENDRLLFKIKVSSEDRGRVVGREGRTIRSLRALVQATKENEHKHCVLELID